MSHVRKQIRDAIVIRLTGLTTTGARVYSTRFHPHLVSDTYPLLNIYTTEEELVNDEEDSMSKVQQRDLIVNIEGRALDGSTPAEDVLDTIAAEVETAMYSDQYFNGLSHGIDLEMSIQEFDDSSETPLGVLTMSFRVRYLTREGAPETAI